MSRTFSSCSRESSWKGWVAVTSRSTSSTSHSSSAAIETRCWASTSSGFCGIVVSSISASRMRRATTAHSSRSPRYLGKIRPLETSPRPWPARPIRCRPRVTDFGDSTWITRSTAPMSMPSSRELVATRQGSSPDLSISSTTARSSCESEPWWARAISTYSVGESGGSSADNCWGGSAEDPPDVPASRGVARLLGGGQLLFAFAVRELVQALCQALGGAAVVDEDRSSRCVPGPARAASGRSRARSSGRGRSARFRSAAARPRSDKPAPRDRPCPRPEPRSPDRAPSSAPHRRSDSSSWTRPGTAQSAPAAAGSRTDRSAGSRVDLRFCGGWRGRGYPLLPRRRGWVPCRDRTRRLERMVPDQVIKPLKSQRQVAPPLGLGDGVDLVDDHRLDPGEDLAHAGGEHQVERLGGGDEDVGRGFRHRPPVFLRGVAGAQADGDLGADPAQRRPQVALDVVGERFQRRDVDQLDAGPQRPSRGPACRSPRGSWQASSPSRSGRRSARCSPLEIASQPPACAGVGPSKEASNQRRTGALNGASGSEFLLGFVLVANPPILRRSMGRLEGIKEFRRRT